MGPVRRRSWFRVVWVVGGVSAVAVAGLACGSKGGAPAAETQSGVATIVAMSQPDPIGDTATDDTTPKPTNEPRADIVGADAAYGPSGITFKMQVAQPTDPRTDPEWTSDNTYATWVVDTDLGGDPDYEIQYFVDDNRLMGNVSRPGENGRKVCDATAAIYGPGGYELTVDPTCLGNPAAFSYQARMFHDTNPVSDDDSTVASDTAPNTGWSPPVRNNG